MSDQFTLLKLPLQNAREVECRAIISTVTVAHLAGLPLRRGEEHTPIALQKLPARIRKHCGDVPHVVVEPTLTPHSCGRLAFPQVEHIALLFDPSQTQALAVVWYEAKTAPLISAENLTRIEQLDWNVHAKNVALESGTA